jgi:hypothetical protein
VVIVDYILSCIWFTPWRLLLTNSCLASGILPGVYCWLSLVLLLVYFLASTVDYILSCFWFTSLLQLVIFLQSTVDYLLSCFWFTPCFCSWLYPVVLLVYSASAVDYPPDIFCWLSAVGASGLIPALQSTILLTSNVDYLLSCFWFTPCFCCWLPPFMFVMYSIVTCSTVYYLRSQCNGSSFNP